MSSKKFPSFETATKAPWYKIPKDKHTRRDAPMNEKEMTRLLQHDFSAGTEAFRDKLLKRCLSELNSASGRTALSDDDLEFVNAAGNISQMMGQTQKNPLDPEEF